MTDNDSTAQVTTLERENARLRSNIQLLYKSLGLDQGQCRACGCPIWWVITKNGKRAPFTAEGLNHFADCEGADQFRKGKA